MIEQQVTKAAFGLQVVAGRSVPGQDWVPGSSLEFQKYVRASGVPSEFLDRFFPQLEFESSYRPEGDRRLESEGVIYIRCLNNLGWFVVHVFTPDFSKERSQPLWLCYHFTSEQFTCGTSLASVVANLDCARKELVTGERGSAHWLEVNDLQSPRKIDVNDLRSTAMIYDRHAQNQKMQISIHDELFWNGLQLLLEARVIVGQSAWAVVLLEQGARLTSSPGSSVIPDYIFNLSADKNARLQASSFSARGVLDTDLVSKQIPLECVKSVFTSQLIKNNVSFASLVKVPIVLLKPIEVKDEEIKDWVQQVWTEPLRAKAYAKILKTELIQDKSNLFMARRFAKLLMASPEATAGNVDGIALFLQDIENS